jgi:hypothetical protein
MRDRDTDEVWLAIAVVLGIWALIAGFAGTFVYAVLGL